MIELYIMVIVMGSTTKESPTTAEFNSKQSCEIAREQIRKERTDQGFYNGWTFISCVKK